MEQALRKPRFKRANSPPPILLTRRDAEIIRHVHTHRFLRSDHISALIGGSTQPILRRLHLLYHNGYLDRPPAQIDYFHEGGSNKAVYGLANRGADLLQKRFGIARPRLDWTAKNQSVKSIFLQHTLAVADVLVGLERACRRNPQVRFVPREQLAAFQAAAPLTPFQWRVTVHLDSETRNLGVAPDAVFALRFADRRPPQETAYFFLEADRATMPVRRRNLRQTSLFQKLLAYYGTWQQCLHQQIFNFPRFRVLVVTSTRERAENIFAANRVFNGGKGSALFLFAHSATISSSTDILTTPLTTGRNGESVRLIDG